ncbi:MAG TPA: HEPN domain-containing protein [Candidatus Nitrosotenuis sp.]
MENAEKSLKTAENILKIEEWGAAHSSAYTAMLHTGRALMFSKGYRPRAQDHHVAVVEFSKIYEKKYTAEVLAAFDKGRRRRHEFQYDDVDAISPSQARNIVESANAFVSKTKEILKM